MTKTEMDIELLLRWAYIDELSKRATSAAEGIWAHIQQDGQLGCTSDRGHGRGQRYFQFGLPHPDAERIERAVSYLGDEVTDWNHVFGIVAGELSGLISVNDVDRRPRGPASTPNVGWGRAGTRALKAFFGEGNERPYIDRPRDVLLVGGIRTSALITMHAVKGTRPDWTSDPCRPQMMPAARGSNAMIVGECRGRNIYSTGSYCPLSWEPSPVSIVTGRAEYLAWYAGLVKLANMLELEKFAPLRPKAPQYPWLNDDEPDSEVLPVIPRSDNLVQAWGKLPLKPDRGRVGPAPARTRHGPVRVIA